VSSLTAANEHQDQRAEQGGSIGSALGNAMNSTAALTPAQRAWINALAPAVVLITIALMGLLG